ncbi:unnamed protein product [Protopolystoma xenopodis]|uniref:Uncharacterized protein n=1 Tax=Protopolystoma xenopodis TaxID=117903 RepID=A0A3S5CHW3_9PLAT|nr:unnamed protein product [Protopolystoma xenopodis]
MPKIFFVPFFCYQVRDSKGFLVGHTLEFLKIFISQNPGLLVPVNGPSLRSNAGVWVCYSRGFRTKCVQLGSTDNTAKLRKRGQIKMDFCYTTVFGQKNAYTTVLFVHIDQTPAPFSASAILSSSSVPATLPVGLDSRLSSNAISPDGAGGTAGCAEVGVALDSDRAANQITGSGLPAAQVGGISDVNSDTSYLCVDAERCKCSPADLALLAEEHGGLTGLARMAWEEETGNWHRQKISYHILDFHQFR